MLERMAEPPAEFARLSPDDQRTLARILQQMAAETA